MIRPNPLILYLYIHTYTYIYIYVYYYVYIYIITIYVYYYVYIYIYILLCYYVINYKYHGKRCSWTTKITGNDVSWKGMGSFSSNNQKSSSKNQCKVLVGQILLDIVDRLKLFKSYCWLYTYSIIPNINHYIIPWYSSYIPINGP